MAETHFTYCRLCEGICGLEVTVDDGRVVDIAPDRAHPLSRGFICVKGRNAHRTTYDPERVLHPLRRVGDDWRQAEWDTAFADIGDAINGIRARHGDTAIGLYLGNPSAMGTTTMYAGVSFIKSLGSPNVFSAMSVDNASKYWVAEEMFGDKSFLLQRDWKDASYMLVLGHNPRISVFGQLASRPRGLEEVRAARARGARLVLVDPRVTESVSIADEHLRITPGGDTWFLLALLHTIVAEGLADAEFIARYCDSFDALSKAVRPYAPDAVADATGLDAATIRRVAREFAAANGAFAVGNTGVSQQQHSTVNEWAIEALNAITGNVDRPGGIFFNPGVVDDPHPKKVIEWDKPSRTGGYPRLLGEYPVSTLADEILTPGAGQIRAMIVVAGNPLVTAPDSARLREAFATLELVVVIDLFRSATADAAHWILPATSFFERKDFNIQFTRHTPFPFAQFAERIIEPLGEARTEWDIFRGLHEGVGTPFLNDPSIDARAKQAGPGYDMEPFYTAFMDARGKVGLEDIKANPHGLKIGDKPIGAFRDLLERRGARIELAPAATLGALPPVTDIAPRSSAEFPMLLIGRRNLRSMCSWLHVADGEKLPNNAEINPADAAALGIETDGFVSVTSANGEVVARATITDAVGPGVVSLQFGLATDAGEPTNGDRTKMNVLVSSDDGCDPLTGMPTLNGIPVRLAAVA